MLFHQLETELDFITQLDGVADSSSDTEEDDDDEDLGLVGEEEFLGMINGNEDEELEEEEVMKALTQNTKGFCYVRVVFLSSEISTVCGSFQFTDKSFQSNL